ncbi:MAG: DUF4292 domain-containing protein [Saprospiraceae bacterium]|nr:DUF4292 domain-containing protein [Saprospiraceae bacterium]
MHRKNPVEQPTHIRHALVSVALALTALTCLIPAAGCGNKNATDAFAPPKQVRSVSFLKNRSQFEPDKRLNNLLLRATLEGSGDGQEIRASANIIWIRDSVIWINVKKFGIEGLRVLINHDSAFVVNRIDRTYAALPLESLMAQYGVPGGFDLLQDMLIGSAWFLPNMEMTADTMDGLHRLQGETWRYQAQYGIQEGLYRWRKGVFTEKNAQDQLFLGFDRFQNVDLLGPFPYFRRLDARSMQNGHFLLNITFTEVLPNGAETYRFEIPEHYSPMGK